MKLVHPDYCLEIPLLENQVVVLAVENPKTYTAILKELWNQTEGELGGFVLSEGDKIKDIPKEMECIFNLFALDCNNKKVINKLYQELKEEADTSFAQENILLNSAILEFLSKIVDRVPYALEYNVDMDILALLKLYGVRIEKDSESLLEQVVEYLKVMSQICNLRIFAFVGLKQYFTEEELKQLYEFFFYHKIFLLVIESDQSKPVIGEKYWILDKDMCIIESC